MRAIIHRRYGGPDVLELVERPIPEPRPTEVVVRVRAASINAADYRLMRADPFLVRLENGFFAPKKWPGLGSDFAGEVASVGADVTGFAVGDAVFGDAFLDGRGAFAEYVRVRASALAPKPANASFEEAATVPLAGATALQGLRDIARVRPGERVLIHGAGGGVGGFAVQIAGSMGAHVTAICGPGSTALARDLGADEVIDYTRDDFASRGAHWDVIVAVNGRRSLRTYRRCLTPKGRLAIIGGTNRQLFEGLLLAPFAFLVGSKRARVLQMDDSKLADDLAELRRLLETGRLRVVIDRTFPLHEAADAMRYVARGHVRGKVALTCP